MKALMLPIRWSRRSERRIYRAMWVAHERNANVFQEAIERRAELKQWYRTDTLIIAVGCWIGLLLFIAIIAWLF